MTLKLRAADNSSKAPNNLTATAGLWVLAATGVALSVVGIADTVENLV